jgi:uncharacterized repeat protein (TIGR01451 family)
VTALPAALSRRRAAFAALPLLIAGLLAPLAVSAPAHGATIDGIPTGFQIDGDKTAAGGVPPLSAFDWDDILTAPVAGSSTHTFTPTGPYVPAAGFTSTGIVEADFFWDNGTLALSCPPPGTEDETSFEASATINSVWNISPEQVNNKSDGCSGGSAYEVVTETATQTEHHILYQYWTRLVGNGDMSTFQVLSGGVAGRCGDYLVEFDYDSPKNQNDQPKTTVNIYSWTPAGDCAAAAGSWTLFDDDFPHHAAIGARNEGPGSLPGDDETFGEIAIDLTDAGLFEEDACTAFQAGGYITKTGNGELSQLIDYIGDASPMTISNCGGITITKAALPADATSSTQFGYVVERTSAGAAHDASLAGTQGANPLTDTAPTATQIGNALTIGTTHTWTGVFAGTYKLTETIPGGTPWALASMVCTVKNPATSQTETVNVLTAGVLTGIPVYTAATTACIITNATSYLVIEKTAVGGSGTFGFDLNGDLTPEATINTASATATAPIAYAPGTQVTITELLSTLNGQVDPDWAVDSISCTGPEQVDGASVTVTTVAGQTTTCTFTNQRNGSLTVTKSTVGGDGTFTFSLQKLDAGLQPVGQPEQASVTTAGVPKDATFANVTPGAHYAISELPTAGWIAGELTCTVTPHTGGTPQSINVANFAVNPGDAIACAITNTKTGTIVVVKNVAGANGEFDFTRSWPSADTAFTLTTTEPTDSDSETFTNLAPGSYTVAEDGETGYDGVVLCSDGSAVITGLSAALQLDAGETITCTWTNTERGTLVVIKETTTESNQSFGFDLTPGDAGSPDFSLTDGQSYSTTLAPGSYTVTELSLAGWALTDLVCVDGEDEPTGQIDDSDATVAITSGETITCTYTNAERGPLTFDKSVKSGPVYSGNGDYTITYELIVESDSNIPELYDLEDEFDFGAGIDVVSASVVGPVGVDLENDWNGEDHTLVATGAEIAAQGKHTYTVTVVVDPPAVLTSAVADCQEGDSGGLLNVGSIEFWGDGSDSDTACADVPISDLVITKDAPFSIDFVPEVGPTTFDYTVLIKNLGPDTAYDATFEDDLPEGLEYVSAAGANVTDCVVTAGVLTCNLGTLAKDATRTITITMRMPVDYELPDGENSFNIVNVGSTSTSTPESTLDNNSDPASTVVLITLPFPPEDPDPQLPTLAITGATVGLAMQFGLGLFAVGVGFLVAALRRRPQGRHST